MFRLTYQVRWNSEELLCFPLFCDPCFRNYSVLNRSQCTRKLLLPCHMHCLLLVRLLSIKCAVLCDNIWKYWKQLKINSNTNCNRMLRCIMNQGKWLLCCCSNTEYMFFITAFPAKIVCRPKCYQGPFSSQCESVNNILGPVGANYRTIWHSTKAEHWNTRKPVE
jgi:hypothetical protein